MSLFPCSRCGQRRPGKLSSATWAWWLANNDRVAYRQRLCVSCFAQDVAPLESACREEPLSCPICHTSSEDNMDPTYLTVFVPSLGPLRIEMATCAPCAVQVRVPAQLNAVKLDDRPIESGGQGPGPQTDTSIDEWRRLGIVQERQELP